MQKQVPAEVGGGGGSRSVRGGIWGGGGIGGGVFCWGLWVCLIAVITPINALSGHNVQKQH